VIGDLVIAGCSRRKALEPRPLPALDRYTGGIAPKLRERFTGCGSAISRIRFLSAQHGLVRADDLLTPYDQQLTPARAEELRPLVARQLEREFEAEGIPRRVLLVLEPDYLVPLADLLAYPGRPALHWINDPRGWPQAAAVLDEWRWP
jgi:hypothetical protein